MTISSAANEEPNKTINSNPRKRRSFLALLYCAGYGWRLVTDICLFADDF